MYYIVCVWFATLLQITLTKASGFSGKCLIDDKSIDGEVQLRHGCTIDAGVGKFLFHYVKNSPFNPEQLVNFRARPCISLPTFGFLVDFKLSLYNFKSVQI